MSESFCLNCGQPLNNWNGNCIIHPWTSENDEIDEFIKSIQLYRKFGTWFEWIPYERLTNIEYIGKGAYGKIEKATWLDEYGSYDSTIQQIKRRYENKIVALKQLYLLGKSFD